MSLVISTSQLVFIIKRIQSLLAWCMVTIFILFSVLVIALALYISSFSFFEVRQAAISLGQSAGFSNASLILGFFGVSGFAIISGIAVLLHKACWKLSNQYIFTGFDDVPTPYDQN